MSHITPSPHATWQSFLYISPQQRLPFQSKVYSDYSAGIIPCKHHACFLSLLPYAVYSLCLPQNHTVKYESSQIRGKHTQEKNEIKSILQREYNLPFHACTKPKKKIETLTASWKIKPPALIQRMVSITSMSDLVERILTFFSWGNFVFHTQYPARSATYLC